MKSYLLKMAYICLLVAGVTLAISYFAGPRYTPAPFGESYTGQCLDIPTYR